MILLFPFSEILADRKTDQIVLLLCQKDHVCLQVTVFNNFIVIQIFHKFPDSSMALKLLNFARAL